MLSWSSETLFLALVRSWSDPAWGSCQETGFRSGRSLVILGWGKMALGFLNKVLKNWRQSWSLWACPELNSAKFVLFFHVKVFASRLLSVYFSIEYLNIIKWNLWNTWYCFHPSKYWPATKGHSPTLLHPPCWLWCKNLVQGTQYDF